MNQSDVQNSQENKDDVIKELISKLEESKKQSEIQISNLKKDIEESRKCIEESR